jgi:hypothetical protein
MMLIIYALGIIIFINLFLWLSLKVTSRQDEIDEIQKTNEYLKSLLND